MFFSYICTASAFKQRQLVQELECSVWSCRECVAVTSVLTSYVLANKILTVTFFFFFNINHILRFWGWPPLFMMKIFCLRFCSSMPIAFLSLIRSSNRYALPCWDAMKSRFWYGQGNLNFLNDAFLPSTFERPSLAVHCFICWWYPRKNGRAWKLP